MNKPKVNKALNKQVRKPLKVAIGVPSGELVHADFAMCLTYIVSEAMTKGVHIALINIKRPLVELARNEIVEAARKVNADKLLFLDTDQVYPVDLVERLLKTRADVVCCDVSRREPPFTPVVKGLDDKALDHATNKKDVVELKYGTSACMLLDMKVFDKIKAPYFELKWISPTSYMGEDYHLCEKLREAGFKIWCDMKGSQFMGHIGSYIFYVPKAGGDKTKQGEQKEVAAKEK